MDKRNRQEILTRENNKRNGQTKMEKVSYIIFDHRSMLQRAISRMMTIFLISLVPLSGCEKDGFVQPPLKPSCKEGLLLLSRFTVATFPGPPGFDSIRCPQFIFWQRPFHIGDTLGVIVSQNFDASGAPVVGIKPVYVKVTSKLGDSEIYLLKGGFWPCEARITDVEILRSLIFYNTYSVNFPSPDNGQLEVRSTGDTLIASYISYCTGDTLRDTVAVLIK